MNGNKCHNRQCGANCEKIENLKNEGSGVSAKNKTIIISFAIKSKDAKG